MNPIWTNTIADLIDAISQKKPKRIGIDGMPGIGKSYLAKELFSKLHIKHFELDKYLFTDPDKQGFIEQIQFPVLLHDIGQSQSYILEGVCLREALRRSGLSVDTHIYVRRLGGISSIWYEKAVCFPEDSLEELQGQKDAIGSPLTEELRRYHREFNPYQLADIVFDRYEAHGT